MNVILNRVASRLKMISKPIASGLKLEFQQFRKILNNQAGKKHGVGGFILLLLIAEDDIQSAKRAQGRQIDVYEAALEALDRQLQGGGRNPGAEDSGNLKGERSKKNLLSSSIPQLEKHSRRFKKCDEVHTDGNIQDGEIIIVESSDEESWDVGDIQDFEIIILESSDDDNNLPIAESSSRRRSLKRVPDIQDSLPSTESQSFPALNYETARGRENLMESNPLSKKRWDLNKRPEENGESVVTETRKQGHQ